MDICRILSKKFYTKKAMMDYLDTLPVRPHENRYSQHVLLASDRKEDNTKMFHVLPLSRWEMLRTILAHNHHLYEMLPPDQPLKMYFDCELVRPGISRAECGELIHAFVDMVIQYMEYEYKIDMVREDFLVLDGCRENKLSFHVILQEHVYMKNMASMKQFARRFQAYCQEYAVIDRFQWKTEHGESRWIMDMAPYSKDQLLRMVNQSKFQQPHVLRVGSSLDTLDTLVRLYHGVGDRLEIAIQEEEMVRHPRAKRSSGSGSGGEEEVETEGVTLREEYQWSMTDLQTMPEYVQYLCLIPNSAQPRGIFRNVGFALRNVEDVEVDVLHGWYRAWAKLSPKYTRGRYVDQFPAFAVGHRTFQVGYLKQLAQQACPEYFDEGLQRLQRYFAPDFTGIRMVQEDCRYVSMEGTEHESNIFAPEPLMMLRAQMGGGKTHSIRRLMAHFGYRRMLIVSPRITFSQFMSATFGTAFYLDRGVDINSDRFTCSMESMYKLKHNDPYDLIVIDEVEANLSVFSSPTIASHQVEVFELLQRFIRSAKKTIFAGAFLTQKSVDFVRSFGLPAVCIWNLTPPVEKTAIQLPAETLVLKLIDSIQRGEKNYCCFSMLRQLKECLAILQGMTDDPAVQAVLRPGALLVYSSETDDSQLETLRHMETTWGAARLVMVSPSVTVGNSYAPATPDFDNVFMASAPTCIVADTFQSHLRVRETKNRLAFYALPTVESLRNGRKFYPYKMELVQSFDARNRRLFHRLKTQVDALVQKKRSVNEAFVSADITLESLSKYLGEAMERTPAQLVELLMFNFQEQTLSSGYYQEMFQHFLTLNNYRVLSAQTTPDAKDTEAYKLLQDHAVYQEVNYHVIPRVNYLEVEALKSKQAYKLATRLEKWQIEKYYFDEMIDPSLPEAMKEAYFKEYVIQGAFKKYLMRLREEMRHDLEHTIRAYVKENCTKETAKTLTLKLECIWALNQALGIEHTAKGNVTIPRERIETLNGYLKEQHRHMADVFLLRSLETDVVWEFKHSLQLLKQVYKAWNRYELVPQKDQHRRVVGVKTEAHPSYVEAYLPFGTKGHDTLCEANAPALCEANADLVPFMAPEIEDENKVVHVVPIKKVADNDSISVTWKEEPVKVMIKVRRNIGTYGSSVRVKHEHDKIHETTKGSLHGFESKTSLKISPPATHSVGRKGVTTC